MNRYSLTTLICVAWFAFTMGIVVDTYYESATSTPTQQVIEPIVIEIPSKEIDVDNLCATYIQPEQFQGPTK